MTCAEAERQVQEALLHDSVFSAAVQAHVEMCPACHRLIGADTAWRTWPEVPPMPMGLVPAIMAQVQAPQFFVRSRNVEGVVALVLLLATMFGAWSFLVPADVGAVTMDGLLEYLAGVGSSFAALLSPLIGSLVNLWNADAAATFLSSGLAVAVLVAMAGMLSYLNVHWSRVPLS